MRGIAATVLAAVFLVCLAGPVPASGSAPQADLSRSPQGETIPSVTGIALTRPPAALSAPSQSAMVFLPNVQVHRRLFCPAGSPFSLQVAALHQLEPGDGTDPPAGTLGDRAWLDWYTQVFPGLIEALEQSGACSVRVLIDWAQRQPDAPLPGQPPVYNWNPGGEEDRLRDMAEAGLQLIGTVEMVPGWARGDPYPLLRCTAVDPARLGDFAQFLTDLVNRYKAPPFNVHTWELRNEPDGTWEDRALVGQGCAGFRGDLYAQMLATAYPAIKAADPAATVLMGGLAYDWFVDNYPIDPDGPFHRYFPDDVMAYNYPGWAADFVDAVTFHYFADFHAEWERWDPGSQDRRMGWLKAPTCGDVFDGIGTEYDAGGIDLIAKLTHLRNRLATCSGVSKPVWITELAEHGYPCDVLDPNPNCGEASLAHQARYVIQGYARGLSEGAVSITWFALISPPYDSAEQGLLYQNTSGTIVEKPAFYAYKAMVTELTGWQFAYTLNVADVEGYVFRNALQSEKTVAWGSGTLTFALADQVRVADRWGSASWVHDGAPGDLDGVTNGSIRLQMTVDPVFVSR